MISASVRESNPRFPYKSTVNIILMNSSVHMSEAVQKQLEIFLFTCLQNLLVFSNQVQIKSNIRLVQKTSLNLFSKVTKSDEIWNKRFHNNKSSILHVYMPIMPLVLATPCDLSFTVKSIEVRLLLRGGQLPS